MTESQKRRAKSRPFFTGALTAPVFRAPGVILGDQSGATGAHQSLGKVQKNILLTKSRQKPEAQDYFVILPHFNVD